MKKDINFIRHVAPKVKQTERSMKFESDYTNVRKAQERLRMHNDSPQVQPEDRPDPDNFLRMLSSAFWRQF